MKSREPSSASTQLTTMLTAVVFVTLKHFCAWGDSLSSKNNRYFSEARTRSKKYASDKNSVVMI